MVEEKEGNYIIGLLACDTHNITGWHVGVQLMGEERNKENKEIKKED